MSTWSVTHDTLHLFWGEINSFLYVDLHVIGDSLDGSMLWETDYGVPEPPRVRVTGRRVVCSE